MPQAHAQHSAHLFPVQVGQGQPGRRSHPYRYRRLRVQHGAQAQDAAHALHSRQCTHGHTRRWGSSSEHAPGFAHSRPRGLAPPRSGTARHPTAAAKGAAAECWAGQRTSACHPRCCCHRCRPARCPTLLLHLRPHRHGCLEGVPPLQVAGQPCASASVAHVAHAARPDSPAMAGHAGQSHYLAPAGLGIIGFGASAEACSGPYLVTVMAGGTCY